MPQRSVRLLGVTVERPVRVKCTDTERAYTVKQIKASK